MSGFREQRVSPNVSRSIEWMAISNLAQHLPVRSLWAGSLPRGKARFPS